MANFKIIYKILSILVKSMDVEKFDCTEISAKALDISETKWHMIMYELYKNGYIDGVGIVHTLGSEIPLIKMVRPVITLKGMEYLENDSFMKKCDNMAKGIE